MYNSFNTTMASSNENFHDLFIVCPEDVDKQRFAKYIDNSVQKYGGLVCQDQFNDWKYIIDKNNCITIRCMGGILFKNMIKNLLKEKKIKEYIKSE